MPDSFASVWAGYVQNRGDEEMSERIERSGVLESLVTSEGE